MRAHMLPCYTQPLKPISHRQAENAFGSMFVLFLIHKKVS